MDKLRKIILIVLLIVIVLIICILFIIRQNEKANEPTEEMVEAERSKEYDTSEKQLTLKGVIIKNDYYVVKNVINKYFSLINQYNSDFIEDEMEGQIEINEEEKQEYINKLEIILDSNYKDNININGIINNYKEIKNVDVGKMYYQDLENNCTIFLVDIIEYNNNEAKENRILVKLDKYNRTFSIIPYEYLEEDNITEEVINNISNNSIEDLGENKYTYNIINETRVISDYLENYKKLITNNNIEEAYDLLDKEYREKRFINIDNYRNYVEANKKEILSYSISQYMTEKEEDLNNRYICKNQYEIYYVFEDKAIMDYTIKLDTYTIMSNKFKETYESASTKTKVQMNVSKWIDMINNKDYLSAYNVLDEEFRNNNFGSVEAFESYMREAYPSYYELSYGEFSNESSVSVQEIYLKTMGIENESSIENSIIMQLNDEYDFKMSFYVRRH